MTLNPILVSICCITYNHEEYIKDAIDGFLMQKTNFSFEVLIHDDASNDGTADIIKDYAKKYPDLIIPILQVENQYSKKQGGILEKFVISNARGKYIAFCEGDDYWTDSNKLQKQVDFLEANPEFGLTYTKAKTFIQKKNKYGRCIGGDKEKFEGLLVDNSIPTLTVCIRNDLLHQYVKELEPATNKWIMKDYPRWLFFAHESKVKFDDILTGVYRLLESSASHSSNYNDRVAFLVNSYYASVYYLKKYRNNDKFLYESIIEHYIWEVFSCWCGLNTLQLKNQIEEEMNKIKKKKSIKIFLIRSTLNIPVFRYIINIYFKIRNE